MQAHGPAISNAYFAKPLKESLSLKQKKKNCGFSKSKFKLMQLERTEIRQERTLYP